MRTPFKHQLEAAAYVVKNKGACLWMQMRTGKTLSSLLALKDLEKFPALIVAPKSVMPVWEAELHEMEVDPELIGFLSGPSGRRYKLLNDDLPIYIANFEMLEPFNLLNRKPWQAIIIDESLKIGNITSKRTQYCLDYIQKRQYPEGQVRLCLSGSPASESPFQLIPQMYFVHGQFMGFKDWELYVRTHWNWNQYSYKWMPNKRSHVSDLRQWNKENSFQLTMKDIGIEVNILKRRIEFPLTKEQEAALEAVRTNQQYGDKVYTPLVRANHELQICAGLNPIDKRMFDTRKIEYILDWHIDSGEPLLVCSELRTGIQEEFQAQADRRKLKVGFMVGGQGEKNAKIKAEWDADKINIIFGQVEVVKMGLNFSKCNTIFYLTNSYSQDDRTQSEIRHFQMGKKEPIEVVDLVCPDTLEVAVVELLEKKQDVSNSFIEKYYESKSNRSRN